MTISVPFEKLTDTSNIIFLDDQAKKMTVEEFEADLKTGYRGGIILIPVISGIQIQVCMMTPYKGDMEIDPNFLREQYKEYCRNENKLDWIPKNNHDYFLGDISYGGR